MGEYRKLAADAAMAAGRAKDEAEATSNGLAAVAFALLEVAEAISDASKPADEGPQIQHSRNW